ncbi:transmembrane protein 59 isoform X2 [Cryptotermes secundus]|uniref:transmembrane protein 59 isoform X2 n=1 Tax=Cryptotermes secundus TaxID=105785 RepID=UPI000CD7D7E0|nr:transmembrane protein 59 isoform X2 [Cryptotermes secundus]
MAKSTVFLSFLVLLCSRYVESDLFYDVLNTVDPCEAYCEKTYPGNSVPNVKYGSCCRQGCRFFTLIHLIDDKENSDLNSTKDACQASCMEAYSHTKDRYGCNLGCASMAKQKKVDSLVAQISWSLYVEDGNSVLMLQPGDFEPDDVLTDPGLKRQLERSWGFGNGDSNGKVDQSTGRLPKTHVKTMPPEEYALGAVRDQHFLETARSFGGDWLDCAARKSGLPRLLVAGAITFAVLLALWLCLAPERRTSKLESFPVLDEPEDPFDCPPKYSLHIDKV